MYFQDIITNVLEPTLFKLISSGIFAFVFLFGEFHTEGIIAVMMLMIFDTILGTAAAYSEGDRQLTKPERKLNILSKTLLMIHLGHISSRRFSRVIQKGIVYLMAISAAYFTDLTISMSLTQPIMIAFVGTTEFLSILENIGRLGFETPKQLIKKLESFKSAK